MGAVARCVNGRQIARLEIFSQAFCPSAQHGSTRFGCRNAACLQKLTCRPSVSPNGTSRAASVLSTHAESLRDSQGGQEDGRFARFLLFAAPSARFSWLWNEAS